MTAFDEFAAMLQPNWWLWESVRVSGVAFRQQDRWLFAGLRIVLGAEPVGIHIAQDVHDCYILDVVLPGTQCSQVLYAVMEDGHLPATQVGTQVLPEFFLSRWHAKTESAEFRLSWSSFRMAQPGARHQFGVSQESFAATATLEALNHLVPVAEHAKYEVALRRGEPGFRGFADVARRLLPGMEIEAHKAGQAHVLAPLPIDIQYNEDLLVRAPLGKPIDVRCFFAEGAGPLQPVALTRGADGRGGGSVAIDWPGTATQATIALLTEDNIILETIIARWPHAPSLRLRMNTYFDPAHVELRKFLTSQDPKGFEEGVVRLLNLLGLPAVWYHSTKGGRRPDAAAFHARQDRSAVVLAECTTEKPAEKLSQLRTRAQELREHLAGTCDILPVIFASCPVHDDELTAAAEHRISLVGAEDLRKLVDFLDTDPTPAATYQVLQYLQHAPPFHDLIWSSVSRS
jgi:hypothetical protein